jgi:hypothetical protein
MSNTRLALVGVILSTMTASIADAREGWIADQNGCRVWNSNITDGERVTWSGPCKDGFANGNGRLEWSLNGRVRETYTGMLTGGHYTGHGTQVWDSGDSYEGDYLNDEAHGQGTFRTKDGKTYSGKWVHGCLPGHAWPSVGAHRECS